MAEWERPHNKQLLLPAPLPEAAGSLRSPAAFFMIAPQQNYGVGRLHTSIRLKALTFGVLLLRRRGTQPAALPLGRARVPRRAGSEVTLASAKHAPVVVVTESGFLEFN
jgi:hypothetical protein